MQLSPNKIRSAEGFSLIEMMIVVCIIGILTSFALSYYTQMVEEVKVNKTKLLMEQVVEACRKYAFDHGGNYPPSVYALKPQYLRTIPRSPWNDTIEISFGKVVEVVCTIKWGNDRRKLSTRVSNSGFTTDSRSDVTGLGNSAFAFTKVASSAETAEANIFKVDLDIDFSSMITAKTPELGADFRFFVDNCTITSATSSGGVPIAISSIGGNDKTGFEYSSKLASDRIRVVLSGCKYSTNFTIQIYRPGDEGTIVFYGEKKILQVAPGSTVPITVARLVSENTRAR